MKRAKIEVSLRTLVIAVAGTALFEAGLLNWELAWFSLMAGDLIYFYCLCGAYCRKTYVR